MGAYQEEMSKIAAAHNIRVWSDRCNYTGCKRQTCGWESDVAESYQPQQCPQCGGRVWIYGMPENRDLKPLLWWWETCSPGCLPDSEPMGPFRSELEAYQDATDGLDE